MGSKLFNINLLLFLFLAIAIILTFLKYSFVIGEFRTKCIDAGGIPSMYRNSNSGDHVCLNPTAVLEIK